MKLGVQVGLDPGHIVLDGHLVPPPQKGRSPQFSAHVCCGQMAAWIKTPLDTEVGLGQSDFVLNRCSSSSSSSWQVKQAIPEHRRDEYHVEVLYKSTGVTYFICPTCACAGRYGLTQQQICC